MRIRPLPLVVLAAGAAGGCGAEERAEAPAATATATPAPAATTAPRYSSVDEAVDAIARRVDVPVVLPQNLPKDARLAHTAIHRKSGQLTLAFPDRRTLTIQYGEAGFDGCGPLNPRAVRVGSAPAVLNASGSRRRRTATLVWPATVKKPDGTYGLAGEFTRTRMIAFAESMQRRATATRRSRDRSGC